MRTNQITHDKICEKINIAQNQLDCAKLANAGGSKKDAFGFIDAALRALSFARGRTEVVTWPDGRGNTVEKTTFFDASGEPISQSFRNTNTNNDEQ